MAARAVSFKANKTGFPTSAAIAALNQVFPRVRSETPSQQMKGPIVRSSTKRRRSTLRRSKQPLPNGRNGAARVFPERVASAGVPLGRLWLSWGPLGVAALPKTPRRHSRIAPPRNHPAGPGRGRSEALGHMSRAVRGTSSAAGPTVELDTAFDQRQGGANVHARSAIRQHRLHRRVV